MDVASWCEAYRDLSLKPTHFCAFFYLKNPQHMAVCFNTKLLIYLIMIHADPPERGPCSLADTCPCPLPLRSQQHVGGHVTPELPKAQTTLPIQTEEAEVQSHPKEHKDFRVLSSALWVPQALAHP